MLSCHEWLSELERQRALLDIFNTLGWPDVADRRVLEIGCGAGSNLLSLLRMGFSPTNLAGIERSPARFAQAIRMLPSSVVLMQGDASAMDLPAESEDIVIQSRVFSSLLDRPFQWRLAQAMWRWVRPGGAVLWYDLIADKPRDAELRGVPIARIGELFPQGRVVARRVTLATSLARAACSVHPSLYSVFNVLPMFRTHVLAWIEKPN